MQCPCFLVKFLCNTNVRYATHYAVLGVSQTASQKEIRDAYLEISKKEHPDKKSDESTSHHKYLKINEAYSVLSKPASRQEYDQKLGLWPSTLRNPLGEKNWHEFKDNPYATSQREYEGMYGSQGTGYGDPYRDDWYAERRKEFYDRQREFERRRSKDEHYAVRAWTNRILAFTLVLASIFVNDVFFTHKTSKTKQKHQSSNHDGE